MKEFVINKDKKVLLIKQEGKFHAIGSKCSHYGAPLVMGSLGEGRIRCPWHGACFNIETGDIEDFPGLDAIPCYQVHIDNRQVKIRAKKSLLQKEKIMKPMAQRDPRNGQIFAIIGGGPSAQTCVETLRLNGFMGRIVMICKEKYLPYDRVKISKVLSSKIEDIQLRPPSFYDDNQIEVMQGVEALDVDSMLKEISLSSGNKLKYDKLFIATGSRARKLDLPGKNLRNIFTLRSFDDAQAINSKLNSKSHVVIIGSSFIGLEVAAYCVDKVAKVTIIGRSNVPLIETFGEVIGTRIMEFFKSKNINFIMNCEVKKFCGNYKDLESIELTNGETLWADVCIMGIGAKCNTKFLRKCGIAMNKNGSIDTDVFLETNIRDIYVGGDIANAPVFTNRHKRSVIMHYAVAQYHGKVAALNMIGVTTELKTVPYFFTLLFDYCFTYTGYGNEVAEIFVDGDLDEFKFAAFYFDEEQNVIGMSSCQPDKGISDFAEKLTQGFQYHRDDIEWAIDMEEGEDVI
jgi:NADPH-dependent 2,4-dienoyl-CoA reductase/sulfur reductase-like enzyme/nitrite reductase/ring-hydroxylating ferredoxin subunit